MQSLYSCQALYCKLLCLPGGNQEEKKTIPKQCMKAACMESGLTDHKLNVLCLR